MTQAGQRASPRGDQLKNARESLSLSLSDTARALGVADQIVLTWERGLSSPDDEQLWRLAELYGRPVGYFFSDSPPTPERQDFRTTQARRQPQDPEIRRLAVAEFEELCRARGVLGKRRDEKRGALIEALKERVRGEEDPETLAELVRGVADLGSGPIEDLRSLMEKWGVSVFSVNLPKGASRENLSGTSWWHPLFGPAALVNRGDSSGRRTFTLAHEVAHLLRLDAQPLCDLNDSTAEERFANRFAASLLMPAADLSRTAKKLQKSGELLGWDTTRATIAKIARRYDTSIEATSFRLEQLNFLPTGYTNANRNELARDYFRATKGKRWRKAVKDLGEEYVKSVREAHRRGELSLSAVADLLRIDVDQALEWLETPG